MTKEELKSQMLTEEARIHEEIRKLYPNGAGLDGIIDINRYLDLKNEITQGNTLKILWILKERGYPTNKLDMEFPVKDCMLYLADYKEWYKTYGNMCHVTEGILEWQRLKDDKYLSFENLPALRVETSSYSVCYDNPQQFFPLDYTAFLNVKKLGSHSQTSNQNEINAEYAKPEVQKILKEQFAYINPDIVIFGNQVTKMAEDFSGVSLSEFTDSGKCKCYFSKQNNKLFIFANHPNVYGHMTNEEYCNSIFNAIKQNAKELIK